MNKLGDIMRDRGITYQALGREIKLRRGRGISESTLTKIVRYDHEPSANTKKAIADVLELQPEDIWLPIDRSGE